MKAVNVVPVGYRADGKEIVQAVILSNTTPEALPVIGDGIDGMNANQCFAPFSMLYVTADVTTKVYIANESGTFIPQ